MIRGLAPQFDRAPKQQPNVRCCWVCGKPGGNGFTTALRGAGYRMPANGVVAHAHERCMRKAMDRAAKLMRLELGASR